MKLITKHLKGLRPLNIPSVPVIKKGTAVHIPVPRYAYPQELGKAIPMQFNTIENIEAII